MGLSVMMEVGMSKTITAIAVVTGLLILPPVGTKEQAHEDQTAAIVAELRLSIASLKLRVDSASTARMLNNQRTSVALDQISRLSKGQQESYKVVNLMGDRLDKLIGEK